MCVKQHLLQDVVATLLRLKALTATVECEREVLAMLEGGAPVIIPDEFTGGAADWSV